MMRLLKRGSWLVSWLLLITAAMLAQGSPQSQENGSKPPYLDERLAIERRVDDLLGRMTLEEKVSQMMHTAPAIERLGISIQMAMDRLRKKS